MTAEGAAGDARVRLGSHAMRPGAHDEVARLFPPTVPALRDARTELRVLAGGIDHPECVAWWEGRVWCGTEAGDLLSIDPASGSVAVEARPGGLIAGFAFDRSGRCWVCDVGGSRIVILEPDRSVGRIIESIAGVRLQIPNYPAVARDGTVWLTDSGSGWGTDDGFLVHLAADASGEIFDRECRRFPNGIALDSAEERLFLVESSLPGVVSYALGDAAANGRREVLVMPRAVPDGLAFDSGGNLYIACWRPDRIYRLTPSGSLDVFLDDFSAEYLNSPTNVCFGGRDGTRMYIAGLCGTAITEIDVDTPGLVLPR